MMASAPPPSYANDMGLAEDYILQQKGSGETAAREGSSTSNDAGQGGRSGGGIGSRSTTTSSTSSGSIAGSTVSALTSQLPPPPALLIPDDPAGQGYLPHPFLDVAAEAQADFDRELSLDSSFWESGSVDDGVTAMLRKRDINHAGGIPHCKGRTFIPNFRPIEILACIHLFSFRLIWDTRMSSGRILQRFSYHNFMFYAVFRGIGNLYRPRDLVGVQDARFWGPYGEAQHMALPNTERVDVVWRSIDAQDVPPQDGKVRMHAELAGFRIEWRPALNGCDVTTINNADVRACIPSYLWNILAKELPKNVGRLREAMHKFGVPPYVLDLQNCVVIQATFFYGETRRTTLRHQVLEPAAYSIMVDRQHMFPHGIAPLNICGPGAHAVAVHELQDRILVSVSAEGVGQQYTIEIQPRDTVGEPDAQGGWW